MEVSCDDDVFLDFSGSGDGGAGFAESKLTSDDGDKPVGGGHGGSIPATMPSISPTARRDPRGGKSGRRRSRVGQQTRELAVHLPTSPNQRDGDTLSRTGPLTGTKVEARASVSCHHVVDSLLCRVDEFHQRLVAAVGNALQVVVKFGPSGDTHTPVGPPGPMDPAAKAAHVYAEAHKYVQTRFARFALQLATPPRPFQELLQSLSPDVVMAPTRSGRSTSSGGKGASSMRRRVNDFARAAASLGTVLLQATKADTKYARSSARAVVTANAERLTELKQTLSLSLLLTTRQSSLSRAIADQPDPAPGDVPVAVEAAQATVGLLSAWLHDSSQPKRQQQVATAVLKHLACRWSANPLAKRHARAIVNPSPAVMHFTNTLFESSSRRSSTSSKKGTPTTPATPAAPAVPATLTPATRSPSPASPRQSPALQATPSPGPAMNLSHTSHVSSPLVDCNRGRPRLLPALTTEPPGSAAKSGPDRNTFLVSPRALGCKAPDPAAPASSPGGVLSRTRSSHIAMANAAQALAMSPRMRRAQSFGLKKCDNTPTDGHRAARVAAMIDSRGHKPLPPTTPRPESPAVRSSSSSSSAATESPSPATIAEGVIAEADGDGSAGASPLVEEATRGAQVAGARAGSAIATKLGRAAGMKAGTEAAKAGKPLHEARAAGERAGGDVGSKAGARAGAEAGAEVGMAIAGDDGRVAGAHAAAKTGMVAGRQAGAMAGGHAAEEAWEAAVTCATN